MRPVVFVDIGTVPGFKEGLVRVSGIVDLVASDFASFRICSVEDASQLPSVSTLNELCLDIVIDDGTGLFGQDGLPILASDIRVGDPVTVLGALRRAADGPSVTPLERDGVVVPPTPYRVLAFVVEGGVAGTWTQLLGTMLTAVDSAGTFDFLADDAQGLPDGTTLSGRLFEKTRVFSATPDAGLIEIGPEELVVGTRAAVEAVIRPAQSTADQELRVSILFARPDVAADTLKGEILSIDVSAGELRVATATLDRCVTTTEDTRIFEVLAGDDSVETVPASLGDLTVGTTVFLTGEEEVSGCFAATLIIAESVVAIPL